MEQSPGVFASTTSTDEWEFDPEVDGTEAREGDRVGGVRELERERQVAPHGVSLCGSSVTSS